MVGRRKMQNKSRRARLKRQTRLMSIVIDDITRFGRSARLAHAMRGLKLNSSSIQPSKFDNIYFCTSSLLFSLEDLDRNFSKETLLIPSEPIPTVDIRLENRTL
jgi:hypothetical protein